MKQIITVTLNLKDDQPKYNLLEKTSRGYYAALKAFFEDIGYKVDTIEIQTEES